MTLEHFLDLVIVAVAAGIIGGIIGFIIGENSVDPDDVNWPG